MPLGLVAHTRREPRVNSMGLLAQRTFDRPAGVLGRIGGCVMAIRGGGLLDRAIRSLHIRPGERVLEVGCGPGIGLEKLVAAGARATGVDPSDVMVRMASRRNAPALASGKLEVFCAPAERLSFIDAGFDKVLAVNCLHAWCAPMRALHEIRRVLRPGGALVLACRRASPVVVEGTVHALQMARFADVRVSESSRMGVILCATKPRCEDAPAGLRSILVKENP